MRMIGKLGKDKKADWLGHLAEIVHTYNATLSSVTGHSLHSLMFRQRPRLPVDFYFLTFRSTEASTKHVDEYMASVWDQTFERHRPNRQQKHANKNGTMTVR